MNCHSNRLHQFLLILGKHKSNTFEQETGRISVENLESKPINFVENEPWFQ